MTWYTIDSAPKDGTEIIGCHYTDWGGGTVSTCGPWVVAFYRGTWRSSWDRSEVIEYMSDFGTEYKSPDLAPTHWQPMPEPPCSHERYENGLRIDPPKGDDTPF